MTLIQNSAFAAPLYFPQRDVILLPDKAEFRELVPHPMPLLQVDGAPAMRVVRNAPGINHLLWQKGFVIPSPILTDGYDWAGQKPWASQKDTAGLLASRNRAYCLNDLGTGKTLSTLLAIDWLTQKGYARRALVVAPLSTLDSVWMEETLLRVPRLKPVILHGSRRQRLVGLADERCNLCIINHDGVKVVANELAAAQFDVIVLDELAVYRDYRTERFKIVERLVKTTPMVWGLTGAPTPNGPADAYAQVRLITPHRMKTTFKRWRDQVAREVDPGVWKPRANAKHLVYEAMQPAVRYTRAQVVDLPEGFTIARKVAMSPSQQTFYERMRKDCIAIAAEGQVTAVNAAVLMGKLLQISCGAVYTSDRQTVDLHADQRLDTALELIQSAAGKVILFTPYRHSCDILQQKLEPVLGSGMAVVHGDVPVKERSGIFANFQDPSAPVRVLLAHPKCMAHGVTLTEANTIIWFAPYASTDIHTQANARIRRPGQTREQYFYHLWSTTVERKIYRVIEANGDLQAAILQLFEGDLT